MISADGAAVSATAVVKSYTDGAPVLRGITLTCAAGGITAVVGPSGSGKSTLLHCLSGLERPTSGSVSVLGTDLDRLSRNRAAVFRLRTIGFVFQAYNLIPALTVRENLALPARLARRPVSRGAIDEALEALGLEGLGDAHPASLSGGQQQRTAIARTLLLSPPVVFADEPTGALDTAAGDRVLTELRRLADRGSAVVLVTHDPDAAARADTVVVLRDGRLQDRLDRPDREAVFAAMGRTAGSA